MNKEFGSLIRFLCLSLALTFTGVAFGALDEGDNTESDFPAGKVLLGCKKGAVTFVDASDGLVAPLPTAGSSCVTALANYEIQDGLVVDSGLSYIDKDSVHVLLTNVESLTVTMSMARNVKS